MLRCLAAIVSIYILSIGTAAAQVVAGAIPNEVAVSTGGALQFTVPIPIIPGTAGVEPKLSLSYSSQAGVGPAGMGWTIAGLPKVSRGPQNLSVDGRTRAVSLDASDAYYLDGVRLIRVATTSGPQTAEFRKEVDDQTRIVAALDGAQNPITFTAQTKGGLTMSFGALGTAVHVNGVPTVWPINRLQDTSGNYIEYSYHISGADYDIATISYTGHTGTPTIAPYAAIEFQYESIAPYSVAYLRGQKLQKTRRLTSVRTRLLSPPLDVYMVDLAYEDVATAGRFRLTRLGYKASTGETYRPLQFSYAGAPSNPWTPTASFQVPVEMATTSQSEAFRFARTTAGAPPSLLYAKETASGLEATIYEQKGGKWTPVTGKGVPSAFADAEGRSRGAVVVDLDADGLDDLIFARRERGVLFSKAYRQTASDWQEVPAFQSPVPFEGDGASGRVATVEVDGTSPPDLVHIGPNGTLETLLNVAGAWQRAPTLAMPSTLRIGPVLADADCDGRPEVVVVAEGGGRLRLMTHRFSGAWTADPQWEKDLADDDDEVNWAIAEEGCGGLFIGVRSQATNSIDVLAYEGSAAGWSETSALAPPAALFWTANGKRTVPRAVDLNGDGKTDLIASETWSDGTTVDLAFVQLATPDPGTGSRWQPATGTNQFSSPFRLAQDGRNRPSVIFRRLDADAFVDVIDMENRGAGRVGAYLGSATQFTPAGSFGAPVEFARAGQKDLGIRFLDLNSDGLVDFIYNRSNGGAGAPGCGGGTAERGAFVNRGDHWECVDAYIPPKPLPGSASASAGVIVADVDLDGFVDLLYAYRASDGTEVRETYLNGFATGTEGWTAAATAWKAPTILADERQDPRSAFRATDVNGDGRIDFIRSYATHDGQLITEYYENSASGWAVKARPLPGAFTLYRLPFAGVPAGVPHQLTYSELVDIDGDRVPDFVERYIDDATGAEVSSVYRWDGASYAKTTWNAPQALDLSRRSPTANGTFLDINSDGLADYYFYNGSSAQIYVATGAGWMHEPSWNLPAETLSPVYRDAATRFVDVNGDGLQDVVFHFATDPGNYSKGAYFNMGDHWRKAPDGFAPPTAFLADNGTDLGVRPLDVDGNGLPDVIRAVKSADGTLDQQVWLNTARRADTLEVVEDSAGIATRVRYHSLGEVRPVTPGGQPEHIYEHGTSAGLPSISISPAMYVVTRLVTDEGASRLRATRYRYGDLRLDVSWARALGFAWKETLDEATGRITRTTFSQERALTGLVIAERTSLPAAGSTTLISERVNKWASAMLAGANRPDGVPYGYVQQQLLRTTNASFDLDGTLLARESIEFNAYDTHGNVSQVVTSLPDGSRVVTDSVFETDARAAWLGRLKEAKVIKTLAQYDPTTECKLPLCEVRASSFTYDPTTLLLVTETAMAHSQKYAVTTSYERDPFGNVTKKTMSPGARDVPDRVERYEYLNSAGRLLAGVSDAAGMRAQMRYENGVSVALGLASSEIDVNGLIATRTYDGFGRRLSETDPTKVVRSHEYITGSQIPSGLLVGLDHTDAVRPKSCVSEPLPVWHTPQVGHAVVSTSSLADGSRKLTPEVVIFDRAGRVIRRTASVFDGQSVRVAVVDTEYDDFGRVLAQGTASFLGQPAHFTIVQYDRLGRTIAAASPNGSCVQTIYSGQTVTKRTWASRSKAPRDTVVTMSFAGQLVSTKDPKGGVVKIVYDAGGRVSERVGATGAVTRYSYDEGGFRTTLEDPDSGLWRYEYDGFGRLTEQRDPTHVGSPRRISYDILGRVSRIETAEHISTYTFRGNGQVCGGSRLESIERVPVNAGWGPKYKEVYGYDRYCRAQDVTVEISAAPSDLPGDLLPSAAFRSRQAYDAFGRVEVSRYPGSVGGKQFAVRQVFHPNTGAVISIEEFSNDIVGRRLWSLEAANAAGRVTRERRGADLVVSTGFDETTGATKRIVATGAAGRVLDLSYEYDLVGNLLRRVDGSGGGRTESYGYDPLDRLTSVSAGGARIQDVTYDAAGRITQKSDVGYYRYGGDCGALDPGETWRPSHGPCGVAATAQAGSIARYRYDELGQVTQTPVANVYYNADNQVMRVAQRDARLGETKFAERFAYGPRGQVFLEYLERETNAAGLFRTLASYRLGQYDAEVRLTGPSKVLVDRFYIGAPTGVVGFVENIDYSRAFDPDVPPALIAKPNRERVVSGVLFFTVRDRLGSVSVITDAKGKALHRMSYDPWGRTNPQGAVPVDLAADQASGRWSAGYTGQQHLLIGSSVANLVHMGGRVYDAKLAVFLTPDPMFTDPTSSQDLNPYMYAVGNPLKYTDPTGFSWLSDFVSNPGRAISDLGRNLVREVGSAVQGVAQWVASDWREIAGVAVGIAIAVYCPPCIANPIVGGFIIGASQAGTTAALYGGSGGEVLEAAVRGGAIGAIGGGVTYAAGSVIQATGVASGSWQAAAAHGVGGGVTSVVSGGRFEQGFVSGAFTQLVTHNTRIESLRGAPRYAANAMLGGVTAEIGGGKFANGAMYGAFQHMFNDLLHEDLSTWAGGENFWEVQHELTVTPTMSASYAGWSATPGVSLTSQEVGLDASYGVSAGYAFASISKKGDALVGLSVGPKLPGAVGKRWSLEIASVGVGTNVRTSMPNALINARVGPVTYQGSVTMGRAWGNVYGRFEAAVTAWVCSAGGCMMR